MAHRRMTGDDLPGRSIPIDALFASDGMGPNVQREFDARDLVIDTDVILGIDVMSRRTFIVFGRDCLKRITDGTLGSANVLKIELDQQSDELEKLLILVELVKGRHEYETEPAR